MKQALYRIYRPKNFEEIVGQESIISVLQNQINTNTLNHAYLFCGPRGTGKTSTAKVLASAINQNIPGSEMDIIEMDAASNNKVENVRDIIENLSFAPSIGKYKIYIIDEVHMLSTAAFNALLKTLEEPPAHIIFILATTEPQKIPQTVLSRCQRFDFKKIDSTPLIGRLKTVLAEENLGYDDEALEFIAHKSEGGLRDALSLLDKAISYGELTMDNILHALGDIDSKGYLGLLQSIENQNTLDGINIIIQIENKGIDSKIFVLDFVSYLKNIILHINGITSSDPSIVEGSKLTSDTKAAYIIEQLSIAYQEIKYSPQPSTLFLSEIVRLINTNFEQTGKEKAISRAIKSEFAAQNAEINQLKQLVIQLESRLEEFISNPQFSVENTSNSVDNNVEKNNSPKKPGVSNIKSLPKVDAKDFQRVEIGPEEKANLDTARDAIPIMHEELKLLKQMPISALIRDGKPERFVDNNLFFCFEDKNSFYKNALEAQDASVVISNVLTKLLKKTISARFIMYSELSSIQESETSKEITQQLEEDFPGINIEIK